jgi:hypothetical protein
MVLVDFWGANAGFSPHRKLAVNFNGEFADYGRWEKFSGCAYFFAWRKFTEATVWAENPPNNPVLIPKRVGKSG